MQTFIDKIKSFLTGNRYETIRIKPSDPDFEKHQETIKLKLKSKKDKLKPKVNNSLPWPAGFTGQRVENGGVIRVKRRNEK